MAASMSVANAAANGDLPLVKQLIKQGADVNQISRDGMTPLSVAAFWGYSDIVELLVEVGADVNATNKGTKWTPLHCAAFQGHGKVIMRIMDKNPDLVLKDNQGRSAVDFASALDSIWPFFAAAGCKRTPKSELIKMKIVQKVQMNSEMPQEAMVQQSDFAHFSRPGSAYVMRSQPMSEGQHRSQEENNMLSASENGDVLAGTDEDPNSRYSTNPSFSMWRH